MSKYIISLDQSTQGTKALLFDEAGVLLQRVDKSHRQMVNEEGFIEHDPEEIYQNTILVVKELIESAGIDKSLILAIGISNQRETTTAFYPDGTPLCNAIVWQCARAKHICEKLILAGYAEFIKTRTGLELSPYFSAAKMAWILEHVPEAKEQKELHSLRFGTMDTYLIYRLTNGNSYSTDCSNASRTQLMNLRNLTWDEEMCNIFQIPLEALPKILDSDSNFGETDFEGLLPHKVPIHGVLGDSQGALFGQGCVSSGMVKVTYGTGSSVMMSVGADPVLTGKGIVSSVGWRIFGQTNYVVEGNINYAGAVINWMKDELQLFDSAKESEELAKAANPKDTTYMIPAFSGLGAPYWASDAKGIISGMTRTTKREEIVRAGLNSIAYQIYDVLVSMKEATGISANELRVDGGATRNNYLMQFQSDIAGTPLYVAKTEELSGLGAAYLAGISMNLYRKDIFTQMKYLKFFPIMEREEVDQKLTGWKNALCLSINH